MSEDFSVGNLTRMYLKLRDDKAAMELKHKTEMAPIKETMAYIESVLGDFLATQKVNSFKTDHGTPYRSKVMSVKVVHKPAFVAFASKHDESMLDIRASKSGIADYLEQNKDAKIPGIELEYLYNTNVRRS